jgi:hypothetical protein
MPDRKTLLKAAVDDLRDLEVDPNSAGGAVALSFLLETQAPDSPVAGGSAKQADSALGGAPLERLSAWMKAEPTRVSDVIEVGDASATFKPHSSRLPRGKANRQRVLVLAQLAIARVGYEKQGLPASEVNALCSEYACLDQNLPHNVTTHGDFISRRGRRGSYVYRISEPGLQRAQEVLSELLEGDGEVRV